MEYKTLSNGVQMPVIGLGVAELKGDECVNLILEALNMGYRSIDTAQAYGNEEEVGQALQKTDVDRKDIFLTTKVWYTNSGYDLAMKSIKESMEKLQTDYLDMCMIHKPWGDYYGIWRALEDLYDKGIVKALGVTTFDASQMIDLADFNRIAPMVNQVETNPLIQQKTVRKYAEKLGVQIEAWAPFARGHDNIWANPLLNVIAQKHGKSVAQIILRWDIQNNVIAIPKTTDLVHMKQNLEVFDFELDDDDMQAISTLDTETSSFFDPNSPDIVEQFGEAFKADAQ
ncbi:MAG: aldo/keto reductase [Eggerthellaceae bacterium]|nr:aldo/keto reductase [Eggerthellaceae bacterium]